MGEENFISSYFYNQYNVFIFILLPQGRVSEAWEPGGSNLTYKSLSR